MSRSFRHLASLALNVVLAAIVAVLLLRKTAPEPANPRPPQKQAANPRLTPAPISLPRFSSSTENRQWFARLRDAGVPAKIIARLVIAENEERWHLELESLQARYARGEATDDAFASLNRERRRAQEADLKAALGASAYAAWERDQLLGEMKLDRVPLTEAETDRLCALKRELLSQLEKLQETEQMGRIDSADLAELQHQAEDAFAQKTRELLGDERYARIQPETTGSEATRRAFIAAGANEQQLEAVLKAQRTWEAQQAALDQKSRQNPSSDAACEEEARSLAQARDDNFRTALGDELFATYQKQQDPRYNQMKHYAEAWGIDEANIDYVYTTIKAYEASVQACEAQAYALEGQGKNVDWDALNKNLLQLTEDTQGALQERLGTDRFNRLRRGGLFLPPP